MVESLTYKYINGNLAQEYATNWEGLLVDPEYNKALNYKIDTVQPSWNPSGTIQSGTIYLYKGNLSPSDFSGGILIELTLGTMGMLRKL